MSPRMEQHLSMRNADRKVRFMMCMPGQILKLLMVQRFTARVIWSKENLTTDSNGAVILKNLHLGTYIVKEKQAPTGFYNAGEEKSVTLSYAGQNVDVVFLRQLLRMTDRKQK